MRKSWVILAIALNVFTPLAAHSEENRVDTQFIFGFTAGADVGERGEKEIEHESIGRLGRRDGSFAALGDRLRVEYAPVENFRFKIGVPIAFHNIAGATGLNDRHQAAFDGVLAQFRYRLLDREHAPFALTVGAEPHWSRIDETSGESVDIFVGAEARYLRKYEGLAAEQLAGDAL